MVNSMFDWPEQIQTWPTRMFLTLIEFFPATVISVAPPVLAGSSLTIHLPSCPAVACFFWSPSMTVTASPASAHPQIGSGWSAWSTMLSEMMAGSLTSARAKEAAQTRESEMSECRRLSILG